MDIKDCRVKYHKMMFEDLDIGDVFQVINGGDKGDFFIKIKEFDSFNLTKGRSVNIPVMADVIKVKAELRIFADDE